MYSGYGIIFDCAGSWSFDNDFARNVIIFGVDNSSSSHADNCKNNFIISSEGPTYGINGSFDHQKKKFNINFTKRNTEFCLSLHYNDNSYLFVNGKEIKLLTFQLNFVLEVYLMDLVLLSLEKYLETNMSMIFQSIKILLINMTY